MAVVSGWECPKCRNVLAPWVRWCMFCRARMRKAAEQVRRMNSTNRG